jgi:hypothetical protein
MLDGRERSQQLDREQARDRLIHLTFAFAFTSTTKLPPRSSSSLTEINNRVMPPGVYLVSAYKRNMRGHCVAVQVTEDEDVLVREDGEDSGIGDHLWMRMIAYIRRVELE